MCVCVYVCVCVSVRVCVMSHSRTERASYESAQNKLVSNRLRWCDRESVERKYNLHSALVLLYELSSVKVYHVVPSQVTPIQTERGLY
jgi:hypothetical protein